LGDSIKKEFKVANLQELVTLEETTKAELVSVEATYTEKCEAFREKYDV
jgi:hypothetical protein